MNDKITNPSDDIQKIQDFLEELLDSYVTFNTMVSTDGQTLNTIADNISRASESTEIGSEDSENVARDVENSREMVRDYVIIAAACSFGLVFPAFLGIKGAIVGGGILGTLGIYKVFF
jgi:t-SNARE complex subunit (syntaxin)